MQIGHIRMMSFGPSTRIDTLTAYGQCFRSVPQFASVADAVASLNEEIRASGLSISDCEAPPMLTTCDEPPEHLAEAFKAAMA